MTNAYDLSDPETQARLCADAPNRMQANVAKLLNGHNDRVMVETCAPAPLWQSMVSTPKDAR